MDDTIASSLTDSEAWKKLLLQEEEKGYELLLDEIINKKIWSNAEILWVIRKMIYFYVKNDKLLSKAPIDRIFQNTGDILRVLYLIFDQQNPVLDDNLKSYLCNKLQDATWGINSRTRNYLEKV